MVSQPLRMMLTTADHNCGLQIFCIEPFVLFSLYFLRSLFCGNNYFSSRRQDIAYLQSPLTKETSKGTTKNNISLRPNPHILSCHDVSRFVHIGVFKGTLY